MEGVELVATNLFGLCYATEELWADSGITFAAILAQGFKDQFKGHLMNERLVGTGVSEFEGILNSPCLITVAKDNNQSTGTISYSNVSNMRAQCWGYDKAVWLYGHDSLPQLMQLSFTPAGASNSVAIPLWQASAREGEPDLFMGRPAIESEFCEPLSTSGDIILGVWSEYLEGIYAAGSKGVRNVPSPAGTFSSVESIHVRFVNHERAFKVWMRNCGRCWWKTPLTPRRGTKTLSPFVVLANR